MCPSCDRLRAELREAREELEEWRKSEGDSQNGDVAIIARVLRISPQAAKIVNKLMSAPSRVVTSESLVEAMGYGGLGMDKGRWTFEGNALKVVTSTARKGLREVGIHDSIITVRQVGYIMPKSKANEIRKLLEDA